MDRTTPIDRDVAGSSSLTRRLPAIVAMTAVLLVMAAVVAPGVDGDDAEAHRAKALDGANRIAYALRRTEDGGTDSATPRWSYGPGVMPMGAPTAIADCAPLSSLLHGIEVVPIDPWGRAYIVLREEAPGSRRRAIISAGPDGEIETRDTRSGIAGDDIAVVID